MEGRGGGGISPCDTKDQIPQGLGSWLRDPQGQQEHISSVLWGGRAGKGSPKWEWEAGVQESHHMLFQMS